MKISCQFGFWVNLLVGYVSCCLVIEPIAVGQEFSLPQTVVPRFDSTSSSTRRHFSEEDIQDLQDFARRIKLRGASTEGSSNSHLFRTPGYQQDGQFDRANDASSTINPYAEPPTGESRQQSMHQFQEGSPRYEMQTPLQVPKWDGERSRANDDLKLPFNNYPPGTIVPPASMRSPNVNESLRDENQSSRRWQPALGNRDHKLPTPPAYSYGNQPNYPLPTPTPRSQVYIPPTDHHYGTEFDLSFDSGSEELNYNHLEQHRQPSYDGRAYPLEYQQGAQFNRMPPRKTESVPGFFQNPAQQQGHVVDFELLTQDQGNDCGFDCFPPVFYLSSFGMSTWLNELIADNQTLQPRTGGGFGFALGQRQGKNLRMELEYAYRVNGIDGLETAAGLEDLSGQLRAQSGMANAWWEMVEFPRPCYKPYFGAGLGFVSIETYMTDENGFNLAGGRQRDSSFAYQFFGGMNYKAYRNMDLFVEYRLFRTDTISIKTSQSGEEGDYNYQTHQLMGGLRWKF